MGLAAKIVATLNFEVGVRASNSATQRVYGLVRCQCALWGEEAAVGCLQCVCAAQKRMGLKLTVIVGVDTSK